MSPSNAISHPAYPAYFDEAVQAAELRSMRVDTVQAAPTAGGAEASDWKCVRVIRISGDKIRQTAARFKLLNLESIVTFLSGTKQSSWSVEVLELELSRCTLSIRSGHNSSCDQC